MASEEPDVLSSYWPACHGITCSSSSASAYCTDRSMQRVSSDDHIEQSLWKKHVHLRLEGWQVWCLTVRLEQVGVVRQMTAYRFCHLLYGPISEGNGWDSALVLEILVSQCLKSTFRTSRHAIFMPDTQGLLCRGEKLWTDILLFESILFIHQELHNKCIMYTRQQKQRPVNIVIRR